MRKAEDEYQDVGIIRKYPCKFSENALVYNSWLTLLPQASYTSTVYGSFKITFDAAGKLHEVHEKVFEILGEIPDRIAKTQVYAELYRSSDRYGYGKTPLCRAACEGHEGVAKMLLLGRNDISPDTANRQDQTPLFNYSPINQIPLSERHISTRAASTQAAGSQGTVIPASREWASARNSHP